MYIYMYVYIYAYIYIEVYNTVHTACLQVSRNPLVFFINYFLATICIHT